MSETPPPLPLETEVESAVAIDEGRTAPPHAPLLWRSLAFLVDAIPLGMLGYLLATRWLMPWMHPVETTALNDWMASMDAFIEQGWQRILSGHEQNVFHFYGQILSRSREIPAPAIEAMAFQSSCMMFAYWIGFSGMEIATKGSSLGKKIFRLKVARFPHGETPSIFDSLIRSFWKAVAISSINPLITIFAVVDAHWPLFNPLRRSLHDLFSRTIVFDARFDPPEVKKAKKSDDE